MYKRIHIALLSVAALLLAAGCGRLSPATETGNLRLEFSSNGLLTKASAKEGELFDNLLVVVTTGDQTNGYTPVDGKSKFTSLTATSTANIEIEGLPVGTYEVFAFANIGDATDWGAGFNLSQISADPINISSILKNNQLDLDRTLANVASGSTPAKPTTKMLLTGQQTVTISVDDNTGHVELLRPVAWLRVILRNHTGQGIKLTDLHFGSFNAPTTFLLDHRTNAGLPTPPTGSYGDLPTGATVDMSGSIDSLQVYSRFLYESTAPAENYKLFATVKLGNNTESLGGGAGSILKKIDPDTHQPSVVTHIRRNEELTLILNVYSGSSNGQFDIDLEPWLNGGTGSHTFK